VSISQNKTNSSEPSVTAQEKLNKVNAILADLELVKGHYEECLNNTDAVIINCGNMQADACYTYECTQASFNMHSMPGWEKDTPDFKNYVDQISNAEDYYKGYCNVPLTDPSTGNGACMYGASEDNVLFHYHFTFGINRENADRTYTFIVKNAYKAAYLVIDGDM